MRLPHSLIAALVCVWISIASVHGAQKAQHYKDREIVPLYVNKIGPYFNPSETYRYYSLPLCEPQDVKQKRASIGERLDGDLLESSVYEIRFKEDIEWKVACTVKWTHDELKEIKAAIGKDYYFELVLDDLPLWGFLGAKSGDFVIDGQKKFLYFAYTHFQFQLTYNMDQVIHVNVTADPTSLTQLEEIKDQELKFTYSVNWYPTNVHYKNRRDVYSTYRFFPRELEIHWISIINSCVLVIFLSAFLALILIRTLRKDFIRYSRDYEEGDDEEDYGWKLVHGDVFRFPVNKSILTALLGLGVQMTVLCTCLLGLSLVGVFYAYNHGSIYGYALKLYPFTSGHTAFADTVFNLVIAGYTSASMYKKMGGKKWVWNIVLTTVLFTLPAFAISGFLNTVATIKTSAMALPISMVAEIVFVWIAVGIPLTLIGGILGKNWSAPFEAPCRTKATPREIPATAWYRTAPIQVVVAGFLPFSAIYIELTYIFSSVWGHSPYTLYGILSIVFVILLIVTACISITTTYFQLVAEDHQWWWRSFLSGGSTAFFVFAYAIHFYFSQSDMSGFQQAVFYFGYITIFCYAFFFMLGSVGFFASLAFVKAIYLNLKVD